MVVATGPFVVASNNAPFKTIAELIATARRAPGKSPVPRSASARRTTC